MILATVWTVTLSFVFVLISLLLIGLILLQKNRGSGLSGAFGGVGGHSAFGTKTGDFLTWLTVGLTGVFMLLAIIGNFAFEPAKAPKSTPVAPATNSEPIPTPAPVTSSPPPAPAPVTPTPTPAPPPASTNPPADSTSSSTPPAPSESTPPTP